MACRTNPNKYGQLLSLDVTGTGGTNNLPTLATVVATEEKSERGSTALTDLILIIGHPLGLGDE